MKVGASARMFMALKALLPHGPQGQQPPQPPQPQTGPQAIGIPFITGGPALGPTLGGPAGIGGPELFDAPEGFWTGAPQAEQNLCSALHTLPQFWHVTVGPLRPPGVGPGNDGCIMGCDQGICSAGTQSPCVEFGSSKPMKASRENASTPLPSGIPLEPPLSLDPFLPLPPFSKPLPFPAPFLSCGTSKSTKFFRNRGRYAGSSACATLVEE
mmetsp:Transcript_57643/g.108044  ORF Transcript_57643/g.108044 Transcript_57643/m.108044 type:complete len:212 (-) Transcript_57643:570-1205(-)